MVSRNLKQEVWDINKLLEIINDEIKAREKCVTQNASFNSNRTEKNIGKENFNTSQPSTSAALFSKNKFVRQKCVFCNGNHWSDQCNIVSEITSRKEHLKRTNRCFLCLKENHKLKECQKK